MPSSLICDVEPFRYQATPQAVGEQGVSSNQINEQALEDWLNRVRVALCDDITSIIDECCQEVGVESFLDLSDTPNTYAGASGRFVTVKSAEDGLEFTALPEVDSLITERLITLVTANANGVTDLILGAGTSATAGTLASNVGGASTNFQTQFPRFGLSTSAIAGQSALWRSTQLLAWRGDAARRGGFRFRARFGSATAVAQQRQFMGLRNPAGAIGNVNPSTLTECVAMAYDSAETTWRIQHNDAAGAATRVDLGANFPVNTTALYELEFSASPNSSTIDYRVTNLETGDETSGTLSTDLPTNTLFFEMQSWINNGTTAATVNQAIVFIYLEHAI